MQLKNLTVTIGLKELWLNHSTIVMANSEYPTKTTSLCVVMCPGKRLEKGLSYNYKNSYKTLLVKLFIIYLC